MNRDHDSRSERSIWGTHLVAGLGSQPEPRRTGQAATPSCGVMYRMRFAQFINGSVDSCVSHAFGLWPSTAHDAVKFFSLVPNSLKCLQRFVRPRFHQLTTTLYKVVVFVDVIMFVFVNWPEDTTDTMLVLTGVH